MCHTNYNRQMIMFVAKRKSAPTMVDEPDEPGEVACGLNSP